MFDLWVCCWCHAKWKSCKGIALTKLQMMAKQHEKTLAFSLVIWIMVILEEPDTGPLDSAYSVQWTLPAGPAREFLLDPLALWCTHRFWNRFSRVKECLSSMDKKFTLERVAIDLVRSVPSALLFLARPALCCIRGPGLARCPVMVTVWSSASRAQLS